MRRLRSPTGRGPRGVLGMSISDGSVLPEALLEQRAWARRLARRLADGEADADDLVQDAFVAGVRRPPSVDRSVRGWLATVLRNLARKHRRADRRRRARHDAVANREEAAGSPEEALATVQMHRLLARLVEELPSADRQIVVLRYFEERTSEDIGRLLELPAATVRWRLARALEGLRRRLDDEHGGDRRRWLGLMLPLESREGRSWFPSYAWALVVLLPLGLGIVLRHREARTTLVSGSDTSGPSKANAKTTPTFASFQRGSFGQPRPGMRKAAFTFRDCQAN